ncbi:O-succinylbenzoic acid--CoA ligase [Ekhidna lutea]|uniref:O-succinylbenzoic acid--CoA ligase n=1 Tax=Ekhidna lutea TaxID=447679 RepID=A0A239GTC0_EKHLU|nr:AMP-binding protein [Ekhidna lutea]SNS71314.1 O-succinylbenzoic acid--CoA ligase [Ekhidna lutea]
MIIKSKKFVLKLEEILKEGLPTEKYNEFEKFVLELVKKWHNGDSFFVHHTSGSTGKPKAIKISREKIEYSARATMEYIDPNRQIRSSLLCLNPNFIGGAMVIYRGLIFDHDISIVPPSTAYNADLEDNYDLVSIAPLQFEQMSSSQIDRFGTILIGGAPMPVSGKPYKSNVYSTFGMTETVSHFALRKLENDIFYTTGDTVVGISNDQSLKLKGTITGGNWLNTNDLIELIDDRSFKWIGRKDFIINTGGIKVNPEQVEQVLQDQFKADIMITSLPDAKLNQKIVLLSSGEHQEIDFSHLPKYHQPKEVYFNQAIYRTKTNKVDRVKTKSAFENQ